MTTQENTPPDPLPKNAAHTVNEPSAAPAQEPSTQTQQALSRIFHSLVVAFFTWLAIWVFALVTLVQWGFLLVTGNVNENLKGFLAEVSQYISQALRYLSFQTDEKPFPFSSWSPVATATRNETDSAA